MGSSGVSSANWLPSSIRYYHSFHENIRVKSGAWDENGVPKLQQQVSAGSGVSVTTCASVCSQVRVLHPEPREVLPPQWLLHGMLKHPEPKAPVLRPLLRIAKVTAASSIPWRTLSTSHERPGCRGQCERDCQQIINKGCEAASVYDVQ